MSDNYDQRLHTLAANTIRGLTMDAVQKANVGHPGMPMGMADAAVVLWKQFLNHNPDDPKWPDRDRFVLSAGHGSMLIYSLLHLTGYDLPLEELKQFRQWGSHTPGHPENYETVGVETTTGPLGQGITNAVGMALAERWLAAKFNQPDQAIVDHHTYVIASDGDLMEGISGEASSLAGHLGLGKLIVLWDDNRISIDGSTDLSFGEDVLKRYEAYGWHTQTADGHNPAAVQTALANAKAETVRPSIIATRTVIGFGSPNKANTSGVHGSPLGDDEITLTKQALNWPLEPKFYVPEEVPAFMTVDTAVYDQWQEKYAAYKAAHPELAAQFEAMLAGEDAPTNWDEILPTFESDMATRASSGKALNAIAPHYPSLLGGSADLTGSNKTNLDGAEGLHKEDFSGRYIYFGVREHAMGGIMNGMFLHGGVRPYGGTFLVFSDYMRGSIRLAALMKLPIIYVFTHDSIGLGTDGPTHQPVEHLMSLRAIPDLTVIRPADANEVAQAWRAAVENRSGPTALVLSRQGTPTFARDGMGAAAGVLKGAYVLSDVDNPQAVIMGTGTEVAIALEAQKLLADRGIAARVVSMPSWELFAAQDAEYQESVLPKSIGARVSIEAGVTLGWERYVGLDGASVGVDRFGASAPYKVIYEKLGVTAEAVAEKTAALLG